MISIPPYLKKGDTVGITCPAGYMDALKVQTCIHTLQSWGYQVMVGKTVGSNSTNYFSATDEDRLHELQAMLDDKNIHAVLCGRGGYGVSRIIDQINFLRFKKNPKWIIGFSDITMLLAHIYTKYKIAALHAPMANAFNDGGIKKPSVQSLQKALKGNKSNYTCKVHAFNRTGITSGELIGGNLALVAHLIGTASCYSTKNKILFIEDIGEYIYHIDRMMIQLKRAGMLQNLSGLIIGGFTDIKDTVRTFGQTVEQVIATHIAEYKYPVCFDFPVSHDEANYALKIGVQHELSVGIRGVRLKEVWS